MKGKELMWIYGNEYVRMRNGNVCEFLSVIVRMRLLIWENYINVIIFKLRGIVILFVCKLFMVIILIYV